LTPLGSVGSTQVLLLIRVLSWRPSGNLTKHMKSKAHSKKCLEIGVPVGVIDDLDAEDSGTLLLLSHIRQLCGKNKNGCVAAKTCGRTVLRHWVWITSRCTTVYVCVRAPQQCTSISARGMEQQQEWWWSSSVEQLHRLMSPALKRGNGPRLAARGSRLNSQINSSASV